MIPPYILNPPRHNTKHIRITLKRDGFIRVSKPNHITISQVEKFIMSKLSWINYHLDKNKFTQTKLTHLDYITHKKAALKLVTLKLSIYNKYYKFIYKKIVIRDQKTRWGSCSRKGNLNFNYRIALIPEHLAEYIIVHELCHLGQFNHSKKFWDLISETLPDYKNRMKELKNIHL